LRKLVLNVRIAFHPRNLRPGRQRLGNRAVTTFHQDCIHNIKRLMFDAAFAQPLQNGSLGGLTLSQQGIINVAPLFSLGLQVVGLAQVSLVREHD
jgi:hypothetical protein